MAIDFHKWLWNCEGVLSLVLIWCVPALAKQKHSQTKTMGNSEQRSFNPINLSIRFTQRLIIGQKMSVRFDKFRDQIRLVLPVCDRARAREYFIWLRMFVSMPFHMKRNSVHCHRSRANARLMWYSSNWSVINHIQVLWHLSVSHSLMYQI